ncbi:hypothetical protein FDP41_008891 [Naegleria fowleri]|uniref:Uncharacterized protein n=1 Tax=Naegleria fowleri TaxID=5763 RepID=A0A6A5BCQ0_NAEFO|nr:uncharacterized protein FDP41_008891 [Naegleria fowleri]KAF0972642.1 hypothetical protein FDP41_008891 [Naegleria fowleri]CAG4710128.1 unnamed protein product [Naegleria fowleri]
MFKLSSITRSSSSTNQPHQTMMMIRLLNNTSSSNIISNKQHLHLQRFTENMWLGMNQGSSSRGMGYAFWPKKAAEKMQQERSGKDSNNINSENIERITNAHKTHFFEKPLTESEKAQVNQFADENNFPLPQRVEQIFNKVAPMPQEYGKIGQPRVFMRIAGKKPQFFKLAVFAALLLVSLQIINHYGTIFLLDDIVKELLNPRPDIESVFATHDRGADKIAFHNQYIQEMDEILSFLDKNLESDESLTQYYLKSGVIDKLFELLQNSDHPYILLHSLTTLEKCARYDSKCIEYMVKDKKAIEMLNEKLLKLGYEMMQEKRIPLNKLLNPIVKLLIKLYSEKNEWITDKDREFLTLALQITQPKYFHKMSLEIVQNLATNQMNRVNSATEEDYTNDEKRAMLEKAIVSLDSNFVSSLKFLSENAPLEEVRSELALILQSFEVSQNAFMNREKVPNPIDVSPLHKAGFKETMYRKYEMGPKEAIGNVLYLFMIPFMMGWLRYRWIAHGAPVPFIRWTMYRAASLFFVTDFILAPISTFFFDPSKSDFARNKVMAILPESVFLGSTLNRILTYGLQLKAFADTYFIAFPYLIKQYESTQFGVIKNSPPANTFRLFIAYQLIQRKKVFGQIPLQQPPLLVKQESSRPSAAQQCHTDDN